MILLLPVWLQPGDVLAWTSIHTPSNHENLNRACIYYNVIIIWITASDWREREREREEGGGVYHIPGFFNWHLFLSTGWKITNCKQC